MENLNSACAEDDVYKSSFPPHIDCHPSVFTISATMHMVLVPFHDPADIQLKFLEFSFAIAMASIGAQAQSLANCNATGLQDPCDIMTGAITLCIDGNLTSDQAYFACSCGAYNANAGAVIPSNALMTLIGSVSLV
jgi:hypothetical protein